MDYRPCKLHEARDAAVGLELEEAFILNVGRKGKKRRIQFKLLKRLPNLRYSDFIHNYQTLNVRVIGCRSV